MEEASAGSTSTIRKILVLTRRSARAVFGTWSPPPWTHPIGRAAVRAAAAIASKPVHACAFAVLLAATAASGWYGYRWYQSRPKPVETTIAVNNPQRTEIENEREPFPLVVTFSHSAAPLGMAEKDVAGGIAIEPALAGTWRWANDKTLEFQPKEDWPVGAEFTVKLERDVVAGHVRLAEHRFKFATAAFTAAIERAEFYQDPTNPASKKAVFDVRFSHPVNGPELEKRLLLQLAGQSEGIWGVGRETTKFTVSYDKPKLHAYVHSEALPTPQEDSSITLKVAKGAVSERGGKPFDGEMSRPVRVPGLASLTVAGLPWVWRRTPRPSRSRSSPCSSPPPPMKRTSRGRSPLGCCR